MFISLLIHLSIDILYFHVLVTMNNASVNTIIFLRYLFQIIWINSLWISDSLDKFSNVRGLNYMTILFFGELIYCCIVYCCLTFYIFMSSSAFIIVVFYESFL